ncbi:MAG: N-6 DNA methylase [Luteolibacter sp.]|uniref:N-6 DNA methylase n=1 Tax=Luteolibacter sp. TaxID=1962973 RepID=UPI003264097B
MDGKLSDPEQLDYLDLLPKRSTQKPLVTAVAENQGTALLYIVDACEDLKFDPVSLSKISRQLANRSDPAWLGVVTPGSLEIYPIGFRESASTVPVKSIKADSMTAPMFFQSLVHGTFEENDRLHGTDYVFRKIFDLLTQTTNAFVPKEGKGRIDALEVLSMTGRALFFRFLIDRRIVLENEASDICPAASGLKDAFSSAEAAAQTSAWLDETFNGDFLPLINEEIPAGDRKTRQAAYLRFYQRTQHLVGKKIFDHLQAILRGWNEVGGDFQPEFDWGDLDFAHIPVGVLSQVYESFSHRADTRTAKDTSVHYTPRTIADLMVNESFAALKKPASAHVLDPSCGAGIFLVLAFRRLVRERWQHDEERPKTAVIQEILYQQLCGFDVSEPALRLAALALYITAIEVNGTPRPPRSLKFPRNLRGEVLHRFGNEDESATKATAFSLGSLGPDVSPDFNGRFDIVIGNPPWTRLRENADQENEEEATGRSKTDELNDAFTQIGRRVLMARGFADLAKNYQNPDKNPDLPFLWRATEWAKPKSEECEPGIIALAMPARLFGRTSGKGFEAWRAILRSVEMTGLLNCADLRKTAVWEGVDMPACVWFARNAVPAEEHRFQYSTPLYEQRQNERGRFRIDYETSQALSITRVEKQPWLLKTLSLGTWLDVEVMETLIKSKFETLGGAWKKWDKKKKQTGQGYNLSNDLEQMPAEFIADLKDFERIPDTFRIDHSSLITFREKNGKDTVYWTKSEELYQSPLVIIPQSPGQSSSGARAFISKQPLAFSQSYYGYSCAGHPDGESLAALIYLLPHTRLFAYFCLMTSRRSGFDRQTFNKEEFEALPFPDLEKVSPATKSKIQKLAHRLENDSIKPWDEIDSFIFHLYGLDDDAVQVAKDTLFSAASYRKAGKAALDRTAQATREDFLQTLREELNPYFDVCGESVEVLEPEKQSGEWREPWFFLTVSRKSTEVPFQPSLLREAMKVANQRGVSRIIVHAPGKRGLLLGLLNQRRWWTVTRARLCAQHIIRQHLGAFGLPETE